MAELVYEKYGTRISECDEDNDGLLTFAFDGTKAMAEAKGWELLPGAFERVPVGVWEGEQVFAYLWPVARKSGGR